MPSVRKSYHWFCRYDGSLEDCKLLCKSIAEWIDCDKIFGMFHLGQKGENPHCHFVMRMRVELQKQSFDKRLKVLLTDKTNRDWSSKIWDGQLQGAGSYMFHEDSEVIVVNKGFCEDEISRMREYNKEVKEKVKENVLKGPGACVERVLVKLQEREMVNGVMSVQQRRNFCISYFLWEVKRGNLHEQGNYKYKAMAEEVVIKICGESAFEDYIRQRISEIYV